MKIIKKLRGIILGFIIGVLTAAGVYFMTVGDVAWQEYFETKLVPNIVLAFSAAIAIYYTSNPTMNNIKGVLSLFTKATADVNATVENGKQNEQKLAEQDAKIAAFAERFNEMEKLFTEGLSAVKKAAGNSEKILRIGFGNTAELVKKGFAAEIAKVGEENEQDKES